MIFDKSGSLVGVVYVDALIEVPSSRDSPGTLSSPFIVRGSLAAPSMLVQ